MKNRLLVAALLALSVCFLSIISGKITSVLGMSVPVELPPIVEFLSLVIACGFFTAASLQEGTDHGA